MSKKLTRIGLICASALSVSAAELDLSSWTELTLDFPGAQGAGNWVLEPGNTVVEQVINADPSFFLNNLNQTSFSIDGSWQVKTTGDDDFMGFVFGYQNSSQFYLFDWKQTAQSSSPAFAAEGMTIKKYAGATGNGLTDLSIAEFWENEHALGDMEVLATNHGSDKGWIDNRLYNFHLDFNLNPGEIHVTVKDGATTLWDVTVNDSTYTGGQFGFYNNSQGNVEYAGFTQTGGVIVDPPVETPDAGSTLALLGLGFGLLASARRIRRA